MGSFACSLCLNRKFPTLHAYLLHVRIRHANDANFRVKCGIHGCNRDDDKYDSLYKHCRRHHSDMFGIGNHDTAESDLCEQDDDDVSHNSDAEAETQIRPINIFLLQEKHAHELRKSIFKYSLKLREKYSLSASTHEDIVADCRSLITSILTCHNNVISCHLQSNGYDVSGDDVLTQNIFDFNQYERLWSDCDSSFKLTKNCGNNMGMVKPQQHDVGSFKSYYVPLADTLKMLVQKEDIAQYAKIIEIG